MKDSGHKPFLRMTGHEYHTGDFDKAVLAVGATEYHGLHLPYGTDTLVSEHVATEVSKQVQGMLMLPPIPYGMSAHYSEFPLAISLKTETLMRRRYDRLRNIGAFFEATSGTPAPKPTKAQKPRAKRRQSSPRKAAASRS